MKSRFLLTLVFFVLAGTPGGANCKKPTISNPVAGPDDSGQQIMITWTTDVPADSAVGYGLPNAGTFTEVTDNEGVTSHSVTISRLYPSTQYAWGIRSQAINRGVGCGPGYYAYYGPGGKTVTTHTPPPGPFTYEIVPVGPTYVTQGYGMYFQIKLVPLTGTYSPHSMRMVLAGLPRYTTVRWSDDELWKGDVDKLSTTTVPNDTMSIHEFDYKEPYIKTNVGGTTDPGKYTITITVNGDGGPTEVATWPLNVVSSSTPFSGLAFPSGSPSSYPPIPHLSTYLSSANTYGIQTCAQDQDASPRTLRSNDQHNLTPVAPCCTYGSWFYDGVMVYYNVEKLLKNGRDWQQCRTNVKQVYRDNYALAKPIQTFMMFTQGYYMDYLETHDPADLALINKFNGETYAPYHGVYVDVSYLQREVAYVMRNEIHGVALGQNVPFFGQTSAFMRDYAEDHVLGMIDQICLSKNAQYWENFMTGLQAEALLQYYNLVTKDPRIPPAIACLADYLYTNQWQAINMGSFPYDTFQWKANYNYSNGSTSCMNTLNNLISPMYAWLFKMTGNSAYQTEGDAIFSHGVLFDCPGSSGPSSFLTFPSDSNGKNYSQQYYWGPSYVEWRSPPENLKSGEPYPPSSLSTESIEFDALDSGNAP
jgi:hypothetical protein